MTTDHQPVPTNQNCPGCGALVFYEGHSELRSALTPHRFHCHQCGKSYVVRSTSHKPPRFRLTGRHEVPEAAAPGGSEHLGPDDLDEDEALITADVAANEKTAVESSAENENERPTGPPDS